MALFDALMRAQDSQAEKPTWYVTWEETNIMGTYVEAATAEEAVKIVRTGMDGDEFVDVQGKWVEYVRSRYYEAREN